MQRTLGTLLVAVMVVFAGCGGVLGGGSDESVKTFTPAPEPTPKPTPTPVPQFAPGLTGEGIENVSALIAAHTSFLRNHSYTMRSNTTGLAPNRSVVLNSTTVFRVGPPGGGLYAVLRRDSNDDRNPGPSLISIEVWSNGDRVLVKEVYANGTTTYDRQRSAEEIRDFFAFWNLYRLMTFGTANTTVTKQFTRNGMTLYRVRGTAVTERNIDGNETIRLRLVVDSRGVIHKLRTVHRGASSDNVTKVIRETRFSNIGTTDVPERPSWVDEALNRTTPTRPVETTRGSE